MIVLAATRAGAPVLPVARRTRLTAGVAVVHVEDQGRTGCEQVAGACAEVDAVVAEVLGERVVEVRVVGRHGLAVDRPLGGPPCGGVGRDLAHGVGQARIQVKVIEVEDPVWVTKRRVRCQRRITQEPGAFTVVSTGEDGKGPVIVWVDLAV
ncbi:MAG: hypothetical protein P8Y04_11140, partial [Desulfobulbaceae bacterium]